jgi:cyanophycinase
LLLAGGAEFGGRMAEPDQKAIELAGGVDAPIRIIPTAAAPDGNHLRAGRNGVAWFKSLGAKDVASLGLIDKISANNPAIADSLRGAKLIYLLGGFPDYLRKTLKNSLAWQAALEAWQRGAVIAGSSAGAMVLCQHYYDPDSGRVFAGLDLVHHALALPHHNTFGKSWAPCLLSKLPGMTLLGIDERTGLLDDGYGLRRERVSTELDEVSAEQGSWSVLGQGAATIYNGNETRVYRAGESFSIPH